MTTCSQRNGDRPLTKPARVPKRLWRMAVKRVRTVVQSRPRYAKKTLAFAKGKDPLGEHTIKWRPPHPSCQPHYNLWRRKTFFSLRTEEGSKVEASKEFIGNVR